MDEVNKLKTKNLLLEKKLENKEAEIDHLSALKRDQPDVRLEQRVSLLEQEVSCQMQCQSFFHIFCCLSF